MIRRDCQASAWLTKCWRENILPVFNEKVKRTVGRGRAALIAWPDLLIATVIKYTKKRRIVEVIRRMTQGSLERAQALLASRKEEVS